MVSPSSHLLMHQTGAATIAAQEQEAGWVDVKPMASLPKLTNGLQVKSVWP